MGTWAADPFGNDTACDWKYGIEETDDLSVIQRSITRVLEIGDEYLEAPEAEEAIAAADTLARLRGQFYVRNAYTESLDEWVAKHPIDPPQGLVDDAIRAMERVLSEPSELLELWMEGDGTEWQAQMKALNERLKK